VSISGNITCSGISNSVPLTDSPASVPYIKCKSSLAPLELRKLGPDLVDHSYFKFFCTLRSIRVIGDSSCSVFHRWKGLGVDTRLSELYSNVVLP
jgi:hypothetical protein